MGLITTTPRCWRRCQKTSGRPWWGSTAGLGSSPSPIATTKREGVHCLLRPRLLCDILHREETATEIRARACLLAVRQCILQRQTGNLAEPEPERYVHLQKRPKRGRSVAEARPKPSTPFVWAPRRAAMPHQ